MLFHKYDFFIFDLDGTIYRGNKIIPLAAETINQLKRLGKKFVFVSNKTTESDFDYYNFLKDSGFDIQVDQIISATTVIKNYVRKNFPRTKFFAIAEEKFIEELSNESLLFTTDPQQIKIVIVTLDRAFNDDKLEIAAKAIQLGALFFAANIDETCPVENGEVMDAGSIISRLEKRTKRKLELHFGKPSKFMIDEIRNRVNFEEEKTLIIGDRLETDIAMGKLMRIDTALVTTGVKNSFNGNNHITPTYYFNSVADLLSSNQDKFHQHKTSF